MFWRNKFWAPHWGAHVFLAAVVIAAAAAVVVAVIGATTIAAAEEQQNKDDDPPATVITIRHTHNHYLQDFLERFAAHSMVFRRQKKVQRFTEEYKKLPISVYRGDALPFGEGGSALPNRERCRKTFRFTAIFRRSPNFFNLFRHALRRATFPKGEGLTPRKMAIC